jgi:hypothetical protein
MSRIYLVSDDNFGRYLVRAHTKHQAIGIVANKQYECRVATQDDIVSLVTEGKQVIELKKESNE